MSAPSFIAKGTVNSGTGASVTPTYPGSILAGDVLFMLGLSNQLGGTLGSMDVPAGWDVYDAGFYKNSSVADVGQIALFYKVAAGGESGTVTLSRTGSTGSTYAFVAQIYQLRGVNPVIESESMNNTGNGSGTVTWNAITVAGNERTLLAFVGQQLSSSPGTPSGYTSAASDTISSGSIDVCLELNTKVNVSADGSTTAGSGTSNGWGTFHLSLFNPAGRSFIVN